MEKTSLRAGVNLGGWLSQYPAYDHQHFKTFIVADDIRRIADWGFDHVRLPVDYPVLADEARPGIYLSSGFDYLLQALEWCQEAGLRVVLDLHRAPGYRFDAPAENTLFSDAARQEQFIALWGVLAERLEEVSAEWLAFELLNEVVLPESGPWNWLAQAALTRIRQVDRGRLVIIGANRYASPDELQHLDILPDPHVLYTFHFYEPLLVTHQRAYWVPWLLEFDRAVEYPGCVPDPQRLMSLRPEMAAFVEKYSRQPMDSELLRHYLRPALDFVRRSGQTVYCGEYGVIDRASPATRIRWTGDFVELLREYNIGRALWSYKAMDFGLVDGAGNVVSEELIRITSQP
ncbi:MAG: cellulase family glycosylhydrolase [Anaerolineales bacterium]